MEFSTGFKGREQEILGLFDATFAKSEGEEAGALIGNLVGNLLGGSEQDLFIFTAIETGAIVAAVVASRLTYDHDDRTVFVLGPVAVASEYQRQGIGQRLLTHCLTELRNAGVDIAMTYGDPHYYSKVGFTPITEAFAQAPFKLNHPEGWLAQSLTDRDLTPLNGRSSCVDALNNPMFW